MTLREEIDENDTLASRGELYAPVKSSLASLVGDRVIGAAPARQTSSPHRRAILLDIAARNGLRVVG